MREVPRSQAADLTDHPAGHDAGASGEDIRPDRGGRMTGLPEGPASEVSEPTRRLVVLPGGLSGRELGRDWWPSGDTL